MVPYDLEDLFSRYVIEYGIFPSINSSHIKYIYQMALKKEKISKNSKYLPELRVRRGSPNTSSITKEFFLQLGAELSFTRVRRPTDNPITERFFGTIKQEEIYIIGNYPDEMSAWEEIGRYIDFYNHIRPHQSLWNFTPRYFHEVNDRRKIIEELKKLKQEAKLRRKLYWEKQRQIDGAEKNDSQNYAILSN